MTKLRGTFLVGGTFFWVRNILGGGGIFLAGEEYSFG